MRSCTKLRGTIVEPGMYVVLFNQTAHGKRYWRISSEGDIVKESDTIFVSEGFYVDRGCSVEEAFLNAFSVSIDDYDDLNHPVNAYADDVEQKQGGEKEYET